MFETIGDFDADKDPFQEPQKGTVGRRDRTRAKRFDLAPATLRFHNQMSEKTCPGSSLDRANLVDEVA
jgi:hypothetical protein